MIAIQRLNHDSSWLFSWQDKTFLLDPWLLGSEIDGFRWLNEQWHTTPPVQIDQLPPYDFIVISQSYEDHCHLHTLEALSAYVPVLATAKAFRRLKRHFPQREIVLIPDVGESPVLRVGGLDFLAFRPNKRLDPIYYSLLIADTRQKAVFYAPHGFVLTATQKAALRPYDAQLLVTTFTDFRLPGWLGGHVNPGMENVQYLCQLLHPHWLINTHDEEKIAKGLVSRFAEVEYADYDEIVASEQFPFLASTHYKSIQLPIG